MAVDNGAGHSVGDAGRKTEILRHKRRNIKKPKSFLAAVINKSDADACFEETVCF